jgi:nucleoside 2-deoxyribosyltransferase
VRNIRNAEAVAAELWKAGFAVICPHMNTALMGGICPEDVWLNGDLVMLERCDLLVLVPGWRASVGTLAEVARANERGIPVYEWPKDRRALLLEAA